jgi:hypothetical protein
VCVQVTWPRSHDVLQSAAAQSLKRDHCAVVAWLGQTGNGCSTISCQGKEFFQRISRAQPSWIKTASIPLSGRRERTFILCQDWPSLLWMANFGCVELIPWNSRVGSLDWPDWLVIDLDPQVPERLGLNNLLAAARQIEVAHESGPRIGRSRRPLGDLHRRPAPHLLALRCGRRSCQTTQSSSLTLQTRRRAP